MVDTNTVTVMTSPANWYTDPHVPGQVRYWDGTQWTEHVAPAQRAATPPPAPAPANPPQPAQTAGRKIGLFNARGAARDLAVENEQLRATLEATGALTLAEIQQQTAAAQTELARLGEQINQTRHQHAAEVAAARAELDALRRQVLDVRHAINVQEFGLYDFEHPAEASAILSAELAQVRAQIKATVSEKRAVTATSNFTFNNSASQGRKFVDSMSRTMLAAYNAEAENAIKAVKAGGLSTAQQRLAKVVERVANNGKMISLAITPQYHGLRMRELELAARHQAAVQAAKEAEREERARLREEKRVEDELRRAREKLHKEREHYANALAALRARGDDAGAADLEAKLAEIDQSIADVDYRAANVRAGYVYVISNVGAFGDAVVKIGMTRRLEPMDRVRELGDASVPFTFDVHALFFSEDAFGIEAMLHRHFAQRRVNRINTRREFFYATPAQVLDVLREHNVALVEYTTEATAEEFRASRELAAAVPLSAAEA